MITLAGGALRSTSPGREFLQGREPSGRIQGDAGLEILPATGEGAGASPTPSRTRGWPDPPKTWRKSWSDGADGSRPASRPTVYTSRESLPHPGEHARWRIESSGREAWLHIPVYLVRGGEDAFEWVTLGVEMYDWILLLRQGEGTTCVVNRNGMLLGPDTGVA